MHTVPEVQTFEQHLEQLKNNVTVYETESVRLQKFIISEQYTIEQMAKQKTELANEVERLSKSITGLKAAYVEAHKTLQDEREALKLLCEETAKIVEQNKIMRDEQTTFESRKATEAARLQNEREQLAKREEAVSEREQKILVVTKSLKEYLEKL